MLKGSCLCGSVQYQIDGELGDIMMCHCQKCRKANGTAYATNAAVNTSEFHFIDDHSSVAEYESTPGVFRVFCQKCGSPLYSRRPQMPDVLRLRIGTLDTPVTTKPVTHIFVGSKAEWEDIHDDLPQYNERP